MEIPRLNVKVSADDLMATNKEWQKKYTTNIKDFGTDNIVVIYVEDERLFTKDRLTILQTLNKQLSVLPCFERIESLFTVSNISYKNNSVNVTPFLQTIPNDEAEIQKCKKEAIENPLLARSLVSANGNATAFTLYLKPKQQLAEDIRKRIEVLDTKIASAEAQMSSLKSSSAVAEGTTGWVSPTVTSLDDLKTERLSLLPFLREVNQTEAIYQTIETLLSPIRKDFTTVFQTGNPAVELEIKKYVYHDLRLLLSIALIVIILFLLYAVRSIHGIVIAIMNSLIAVVWTLGAMTILGLPLNMLNVVAIILVLIIGSTQDVQFLVIYKEILRRGWRGVGAITDVGHTIGLTLGIATITTLLGFMVACIFDITILKIFAYTAGIAIVMRFICTTVLLPAYLGIFDNSFTPQEKRANKNSWVENVTKLYLHLLMTKCIPKPNWFLVAFALALIPAFYYARTIIVNNNFLGLLNSASTAEKQLDTLSQQLSGINIIHLTIEGNPNDFKQARKIQTIENIVQYLRKNQQIDSVIAVSDYMALTNKAMNENDPACFYVPRKDEQIAQYINFFPPNTFSPYLTENYARTNIIIRCHFNDSRTFNHLLATIKHDLDTGMFGPIHYTLTGENVLIAQSANQLSSRYAYSIIFMGFAIFSIFSTLFISFKTASATVISNLWSIGMLLGIMGLFAIPLNTATCMVASITIGIGIVNTLQQMVRYNKEFKHLKSEILAIEKMLKIQFFERVIINLVIAGGFALLAFSNFKPIAQFGLLGATVVILALIADSLLMPILLSKTRLTTLSDLVKLNIRKTLISNSPVFKGMNPFQAKKLILASNVEEYRAGTTIVHAGDDGDQMYVILEGDLEVSVAYNEKRILLSYLSTGEVFGELALISKSKRTADVVAKTDTKLLVYNWESLVRLRRFAPFLSSQLLLNLASILGMRLVDAQRKLDNSPRLISGHNANTRKTL